MYLFSYDYLLLQPATGTALNFLSKIRFYFSYLKQIRVKVAADDKKHNRFNFSDTQSDYAFRVYRVAI